MKTSNSKQISFVGAFVSKTKYNSFMFRIISSNYLENKYLKQKLKHYEGSNYIHIKNNKINIELDRQTKYKVYILFDDFEKDGDYILYYKEVLIKNKGKLDERIFNSNIIDSDDEDERA